MPLVWAHAEYAKLVRSLHDGRVFDMPQQPYERYIRARHRAVATLWSRNTRPAEVEHGVLLRIQTSGACQVEWWTEGGSATTLAGRDSGLGAWIVDVDTAAVAPGATLRFRVTEDGRGEESSIAVAPARSPLRGRASRQG